VNSRRGDDVSTVLAAARAFAFFTQFRIAKESRQSWEDATLKSLSLREKIGQLIHIRIPGKFLNRQSLDFLASRMLLKRIKLAELYCSPATFTNQRSSS